MSPRFPGFSPARYAALKAVSRADPFIPSLGRIEKFLDEEKG
jgi:hypothetical protein